MAKLAKIIGFLLASLLEYFLLFFILFAFAIRSSFVQTRLAKEVAGYFASEWNTKVEIDKIDVVFFDKVYINGLYVEDLHKDTLAYIGEAAIVLRTYNLEKNSFSLKSVALSQGAFKLKRYPHEQQLNLQFIIDYFKTDKPPSKTTFSLDVKQIRLANLHFVFDDASKTPIPHGMDYMHLDIKGISLEADRFSFQDNKICAYINYLSAHEKGGFNLSHLAGYAVVSPQAVSLKKGHIQTPRSSIRVPYFSMHTGTYGNFADFVDSVTFNSKLAKSEVSMEDVVQFAPMLWGMDQKVTLSARVTGKVKDMKITHLLLSTGQTTQLAASFQLPDFRNFESESFHEHIVYLKTSPSDLQNIRLPDQNGHSNYIRLPQEVQRMGLLQAEALTLEGDYASFSLSFRQLLSDACKIRSPQGIDFYYDQKEKIYQYHTVDSLLVDFVDIGRIIDNPKIGVAEGKFSIQGKGLSASTFELTHLEGDVTHFNANGYNYSNIVISEASVNQTSFKGNWRIDDRNLQANGDVDVGYGKIPYYIANIELQRANLKQLNFTEDSTQVSATMQANIQGKDIDSYAGKVTFDELNLSKGGQKFELHELSLEARRNPKIDSIILKSQVADAHVYGKVNFMSFVENISYQFQSIFPALFAHPQKPSSLKDEEFEYAIVLKDIQPILDVYVPELQLAKNTEIKGNYSSFANAFNVGITSNSVAYNTIHLSNLSLNQDVIGSTLDMDYSIGRLYVNDSLQIPSIHFITHGEDDVLQSELNWDLNNQQHNPGEIEWKTRINALDDYSFFIHKSYFNLKRHLWAMVDSSSIRYRPQRIEVAHLKLNHENQLIIVNGIASNSLEDELGLAIKNLDLADISSLFGAQVHLTGILNGEGSISTPFTDLKYSGDLHIADLFINKNEVGDIDFKAAYLNESKQISILGKLFYRDIQSIGFLGSYYLARTEDNLALKAVFDHTNISFVNAFLNKEVVSNIHGFINGKLNISGTLTEPVVEGKVELGDAGAHLAMFGTDFGLSGEIEADKDGFYINNMPIFDQEGDAGSLVGSVLHTNFKNWNFDLSFNLQDDAIHKDPNQPWKVLPLKKFLVLNTPYKEGTLYYGRGYVTGTANVFGYTNDLEITVNCKTEKGTSIIFPMYGKGDIEEDDDLITFVSKDTLIVPTTKKINFSGVSLDLNFNITKDAQVKIIFNENTGDEIKTTGTGNLQVDLDQLNQLTLEGVYTVDDGEYNFAMGPIKKKFFIEKGGTVQWTGDPYDAALNLRTYYLVNANLTDVLPSLVTDNTNNSKDQIYCYLDLTESISKPNISFDIQAPRSSEQGKTIINRIKSTPDELNKQFFSLLLFRKFQPLVAASQTSSGASNAAFEVISNQINSVLDKVSQDYKLSVKMNNDAINKQNTYEFGVSKGFLDDRLILSGNFGVNQVNNANKQGAQNNFIGDVNLEYKLNESGTFRVNVFNKSNQYDVINKKNLGLFTQGIGLHYQESFRNFNDFKLIQFVLDLFRKPENRKYLGRKKNKRTPIPKDKLDAYKAIKNEENTHS